jgi:asparagine synthase (glutamine-hydrolysing)
MCGIAGFVDFNQQSSPDILKKSTDALLHRGPDGSDYEFFQNANFQVGLGHRRLSIIDLTEGGKQPMNYEQYWITYNGEVYNFAEIKSELISLGHSFHSTSDTEVILHSFQQWGKQAVHKFNGMFAFVIYDTQNQKLYCYRDRAGVKPFYYYWDGSTFLFSSELKAFHEHPGFKKEIDTNALGLFFQYGYIPAPHCIFKSAMKLLQGHYLEFDLSHRKLSQHKYWDVNDAYSKSKLKISEKEAIEETEKILISAFQYRMVADVPVGVFLSGGYDSTAVTALLQANMSSRLKTFTIGFHEQNFNEATYAKQVAAHLGTEHTEYYCTQQEAKDILPQLPFFYDEPFGDSSAIPTILVSRLARKDVTVSLSADAGDEVFAGYERYPVLISMSKKLAYVPDPVKKAIAAAMGILNPSQIPLLNKRPLIELRYEKLRKVIGCSDAAELLRSMSTIINEQQTKELLRAFEKSPETYFDEKSLSGNGLLDQLLAKDYKTYMADDILTKVDRATMSCSLEGREPFLDYRIIEWVATLPDDFKIRNGTKKYLLREIVHKYVPKQMMDRPKMGFGVPIKEWFKSELAEYFNQYLSKTKIESQGLVNYNAVKVWLENYNCGRTEYINHLWYLLMFQMWYERWMEN